MIEFRVAKKFPRPFRLAAIEERGAHGWVSASVSGCNRRAWPKRFMNIDVASNISQVPFVPFSSLLCRLILRTFYAQPATWQAWKD